MNLDRLPERLRDDVDRAWARVRGEAGVEAADALLAAQGDRVARVLAASRFVGEALCRSPDDVAAFAADGRLDRPLAPGELAAAVSAAVPMDADEPVAMASFRRFRRREMVRIAWRDLAGLAPLEETLAELSELADVCIRHAAAFAREHLSPRHGVPRDGTGRELEPVFLGMGKLGGGELNFSSDIDLVLLFEQRGDTDGPRPLAHERYFVRLGQRVIRLLDEVTADGFVHRVDMRLRPFGVTGALALSFDAFEGYLVEHGREWERYAYVKARAVTGSDAAIEAVEAIIRPFVYRRYLDFGVFESLRDMKAMIRREVARRELEHDVKLGPGGIREIEFIGQAYQLIRGGREPALQTRRIVDVLNILGQRRLLPADAVDELIAAYEFLRRLENRIQALDDRQVHRVPDEAADRDRLALSMDSPDWATLAERLDEHRANVARHFEAVMFNIDAPNATAETRADHALAPAWRSAGPDVEPLLESAGYSDPQRVIDILDRLRAGPLLRRLDERGAARVDKLVPAMLEAAGKTPRGEDAMERLAAIVESVGLRSAYFALLTENPGVLERLVSLCARSSLVAHQVSSDPLLLDSLIDPALYSVAPSREQFARDLAQRFDGIDPGDDGRLQETLSQFQRSAVFQVVVADLSGILPLMKVSDRLTDIAELVLEQCLALVNRTLSDRHGLPHCIEDGARRRAGFAIVAYGKLGGLELGYGSDLDIVFLHNSAGTGQVTDGERSLDNARYFGRLAQRIVTLLTAQTGSGAMYEVDTRLRPSGRAGLLVSSLAGFEEYQADAAWTWEHQALLRARPVAGDAAVKEAFNAVRRRILTAPRDAAALREQVVTMRERMRRDLRGGGAGGFHVKRDPGGITDIEFLVQYWVLRSAAEHPVLVRWSDNIRQLDDLADCGLVSQDTAHGLQDAYRAYRRRLHRRSLVGEGGTVGAEEFGDERALVTGLWHESFGAAPAT